MAEVSLRQTLGINPFYRLLGRIWIFLVIFILTLGFEFFSNLIVFVLLGLFLKYSKFQGKLLIFSVLLLLFLLPFYFMYYNDIYLKYWIFILRMLLIVNLFNFLFKFKLKTFNLKPILNTIYYTHVACIFLCFVSPQINAVVTNIFAFSVRDGNFRVSGFFSGFDVVPYFILVYLAYDHLNNKNDFRTSFLVKLLLGAFTIFLGGRFGVIPLALFVGFLFLKFINTKWVFIALPILYGFFLSRVLDARIENITSTIEMLQVAAVDLEQVDNSFFEGQEIKGQYNQSPLTWYYEFMKPFKDLGQYILPGIKNVVDSGPSFFVLNFGIFIAILLYVLYFYIFKNISKEKVPWLVIVLILSSDLKFRLIYSLMPLIWLLLNHLHYTSQKNKELSNLS